MKFVHLSDLHLGKRVNEFPLVEDQRFVLRQILTIIANESPDAVVLAGDIYDKSVPSVEAVNLLDEFLVGLSGLDVQVMVISGNHDSADRLSFAGRLLDRAGVHLSPVYDGHCAPVRLEDEYGRVNFYLLPFLKPIVVKRFFEREVVTFTDAVEAAIDKMEVDCSERNVLVTHQFVTGASRTDSEEVSLGGADNVDAEVFAPFDYVALGHIHRPQFITSTIRYCGSPLKYSFSEAEDVKTVTVVELGRKGEMNVREITLTPLRDMVELRGTYEQLTFRGFYELNGFHRQYVHLTLTDEMDVPNAIARLRLIYPYLMKLDYDNARTRHVANIEVDEEAPNRSPLELFVDFYARQNGAPPTDEQRAFVEECIQKIWEEEA